jgi:hypothetical protein
MQDNVVLKDAEQRAFRATLDHGLWDLLLGCCTLVFVIVPFLSSRWGDFWSSFLLVPVFGIAYFALGWLKRAIVTPRVGVVEFRPPRLARLRRFNVILVVAMTLALTLGLLSASNISWPGWVHAASFALVVLMAFGIAAYFLGFARLYLYGALLAASPFVGEWLYRRTEVPHHGLPVTLGITATVMIAVGLTKFFSVLRSSPMPSSIEGQNA